MTSVPAPMCVVCVHKHDLDTCAAYPDGIPTAIYLEGADHRHPFPGDGGVRFAPNMERWDADLVTGVLERYGV